MRRASRLRRGVTLIEIMVAIGIMTLVASITYGAFDAMSRTKRSVEESGDRFQQGRAAMTRITREVQAAFLSLHRPILNPGLQVSQTIFKGTNTAGFDRLDFTSFSHRRLGFSARESDQNELSYFVAENPETGENVLARRESTVIDMNPTTGGNVLIMAEGVRRFELAYLDPVLGEWVDSWDTTQPTGQFERLPSQVRIEIELTSRSGAPYQFITKAPVVMRAPLTFGIPR
jgi:general secretion pathway protein J